MTKDYADVDYAKLTTNDRNPIKRNLQKLRLAHSLHALRELPVDFSGKILDFGAGNGELCKQISSRFPQSQLVCYEPAPMLRKQALQNTQGFHNIKVVDNLQTIENDIFDFIFCLEVFEHLPDGPLEQSLTVQKKLLKTGGRLILGVPNELFLPALLKGSFRLTRRYGEVDARPLNILKAIFGRPPRNRPQVLFDDLPYIIRHIGFDYRKFRKTVEQYFNIEKTYGSPLPFLPLSLNFEIYFICSK